MQFFQNGLRFSVPFLAILTVHEFGHYFTSRFYKIKVSLPYYIPFFGLVGTLGAFIRIKSIPRTTRQFFDVGIAGPLAGFILALAILIYAFLDLPSLDYLFNIHKEYAQYGADYASHVYKNIGKSDNGGLVIAVGDNLLFKILELALVKDKSLIPHAFEMIHFPLLLAGYMALFFTALNLLPIGQLDGGHILYGLVGRKKHKIISDCIYVLLVVAGGMGILNQPIWDEFVPLANFDNFILFTPIYLMLLYIGFFSRLTPHSVTNFLITVLVFVLQYAIAELLPDVHGFFGYLVFAFVIGRFLGTEHPQAQVEEPLGLGRKLLGWLAILIFVLCFSFEPIYLVTSPV